MTARAVLAVSPWTLSVGEGGCGAEQCLAGLHTVQLSLKEPHQTPYIPPALSTLRTAFGATSKNHMPGHAIALFSSTSVSQWSPPWIMAALAARRPIGTTHLPIVREGALRLGQILCTAELAISIMPFGSRGPLMRVSTLHVAPIRVVPCRWHGLIPKRK